MATAFVGATAGPTSHASGSRRAPSRFLCSLSPLQEGIKAVAVGKHGARPIPEGLVGEIAGELGRLLREDGFVLQPEPQDRNIDVDDTLDDDEDEGEDDLWVEERLLSPETYRELLHRASFLGALYVKHTLMPHEVQLLQKIAEMASERRAPGVAADEAEKYMRERRGCSPQDLLAVACPRLDQFGELYGISVRLLNGEFLSKEEARELGSVLFAMPAPVLDDDESLSDGSPFLSKDPALPPLTDNSRELPDADQLLMSYDDAEEDEPDEEGPESSDVGRTKDPEASDQDSTLDPVRVMIAHVMRVRHETSDELCGLQEAMMDAISEPYVEDYDGDVLLGRLRIAHLADPFDGVRHCFMIGPLLARHLQNRWGYNCSVTAVGRSSGPKLPPRAVNGRDLIDAGLDAHLISENNGGLRKIYYSGKPNPRPCGFFVDQSMVAPGLDRWVEMRRTIIKRPSLAMLEKYLDVTRNASLMVLSAFHSSVVDKMLDMSENMGIPATIVIYHGLEGSLSVPIHRSGYAMLSCSVKIKKTGEYIRKEIKVTSEEALMPYRADDKRVKLDETQLSAELNADLINAFIENGVSGNPMFDKQVRATCVSVDKAMKWIHFNSDVVGWQRWSPLHGVKGLT